MSNPIYHPHVVQYPQLVDPFVPSGVPPVVPDQPLATFPDVVRPRVLSVAAIPFFFAVFVLPDVPVPDLAWEPEYPNFAGREAERPPEFPAFFFDFALENLPVPDLSWEAEFPDFALGPKPLVPEGEFVAPVEPPAAPAPDLSWEPEYPDFAREAERAPEYQPFFYTSALPQLPIPDLSWEPETPDFARGPAPLVPEGQFAFDFALPQLPVPDLSWEPEFADFARAPEPVEPGLFAFVPDLASFAVPDLSWESEYPDFARAAQPPVAEGDFAQNVEPLPTTEAPDLSWEPDFPASARAALDPNTYLGLFALVPDLASFAVPDLSWEAEFPDFARLAERVADFPALALTLDPDLFGIDGGQIPWESQFPDFARVALDPNTYTGSRTEFVPAIADFPVPDLSWDPDFPDQLLPVPFEPGLSVFVPDLPSFAVPDLAWEAEFPDFARAPLPRFLDGVAPGRLLPDIVVVPDLSWEGEFPDFARARPPIVPEGGIFQGPVLTPAPVGFELAWLPDYPVVMPPPPRSADLLTSFGTWNINSPIWVQYESILQFDPLKYSTVPFIFFEAVLESSGGGRVFARAFNITDDSPVGASEVATDSTTPIRVRSGNVTLPGLAKEYRAEIGASFGESVIARSGRYIVNQGDGTPVASPPLAPPLPALVEAKDTTRFILNGKLVTGLLDGVWIPRRGGTITGVTLLREFAGNSGTTIVDVNINGVTIFTNQSQRPFVAASDGNNATSVPVPQVIAFVGDDEIRVEIDQREIGNPINITLILEFEYDVPVP